MKKIIFRILAFGLLTYVMLIAFLFFFQESLIFPASSLEKDYTFQFNSSFEEVNLKSEDGTLLNALHFKHENPKGIILYYHGNGGDLSRWGNVVEPLLKYGYEILIMDYRGYGKSDGDRDSKKMYEDAEMFYKKAKTYFFEDSIFVYGRSLGCTFATYVASKNNPKQLILESPFYNMNSLVDERYGFLPTNALLQFNFPTNQFIPDVDCPILIFHGVHDAIIPFENGKKLVDIANNTKWILIEEAKHNNLADYDKYWTELELIF